MSQQNNSANKEEISLKQLLDKIRSLCKYIYSKWIFVLTMALLGLAVGVIFSGLKQPQFVATTTFVLETSEGGTSALSPYAGIASIAGIDLGNNGGGIFQGDNIFELYKSRAIIVQTLLTKVKRNGNSELLITSYLKSKNLQETWKGKFVVPAINTYSFDDINRGSNRLQDSILNIIVNDIKSNSLSVTKPDKKLNIISAEVKSSDEFFAKSFNEEIVKNVNNFYVQTKTKKALENIRILTEKSDSVSVEMIKSISKAATTIDATPNLNLARQAQRVVPMQKSQISSETNKTILEELVKNLELAKMSLLKDRPLIQIIDSPIYPLTKVVFSRIKWGIIGCVSFFILSTIFLTLKMFFNATLEKEKNK